VLTFLIGDKMRRTLVGDGNVMFFVVSSHQDPEVERQERLIFLLKEMAGDDRVINIIPAMPPVKDHIPSTDVIIFPPGRIKEVFWLVLDKMRRSLVRNEVDHSL